MKKQHKKKMKTSLLFNWKVLKSNANPWRHKLSLLKGQYQWTWENIQDLLCTLLNSNLEERREELHPEMLSVKWEKSTLNNPGLLNQIRELWYPVRAEFIEINQNLNKLGETVDPWPNSSLVENHRKQKLQDASVANHSEPHLPQITVRDAYIPILWYFPPTWHLPDALGGGL